MNLRVGGWSKVIRLNLSSMVDFVAVVVEIFVLFITELMDNVSVLGPSPGLIGLRLT